MKKSLMVLAVLVAAVAAMSAMGKRDAKAGELGMAPVYGISLAGQACLHILLLDPQALACVVGVGH